jgi:N-acyl-D-amino-acid deacylase
MAELLADTLIRGATLHDGSGSPGRRADVAVRGDRILWVGDAARPGAPTAGLTVDAQGQALAPGFIDVHSHDDVAVLLYPRVEFKLLQGVTTDVVGNCGLGAAPHPIASQVFRAMHPHGEIPVWEGFAGYLATVDREAPSCNVAALAGHGLLRAGAMGGDARAPSARELGAMRDALREALDAGVIGLSTGLIYDPGRHAKTEEIVALARELHGTRALYATHMRDESDGLLDSVRETLRIGEEAGVPVQVSHHKASGRSSWGLVADSLRLLDDARARGLDATADQYPYTAGSTVLDAVLTHQRAAGGRGGLGGLSAEDVMVCAAPGHESWEGRDLGDLARELGLDPWAAAEHIVAATRRGAWVVLHTMCEDDVRRVMRHPTTMIGSDGIATLHGKPHPRLFGTFARVLGHYARDLGVLSLEEAVHKMTGLPARKFGLEDRGVVRAGAFADLVLFDPLTVDDVATYADPKRSPRGISQVWVNGTQVVRDGVHTGARPGRALRRAS